jgi:hypothetical protein
LHGRAGVALDGEGFVLVGVEREVFGHGMAAGGGPPEVQGWARSESR